MLVMRILKIKASRDEILYHITSNEGFYYSLRRSTFEEAPASSIFIIVENIFLCVHREAAHWESQKGGNNG